MNDEADKNLNALNERITALESYVAYLENSLNQLDAVVLRQEKSIARLEKQWANWQAESALAKDKNVVNSTEEEMLLALWLAHERPPHY